jgi:hypothetical protein
MRVARHHATGKQQTLQIKQREDSNDDPGRSDGTHEEDKHHDEPCSIVKAQCLVEFEEELEVLQGGPNLTSYEVQDRGLPENRINECIS